MEQQRAAETAGHEYMEDEDDFDNVSKINERNFEMATSEARRSGRSCRRGTIVRADESFSCFPGPSGQYRCWRGRRQEPVHQRNCCERDCWGVGERGIERDKRNVDVSAPCLFMGRRPRIRSTRTRPPLCWGGPRSRRRAQRWSRRRRCAWNTPVSSKRVWCPGPTP